MADYNNDTSWLLQNEEEDYISRSSNNSSNVDLISMDYPEAAGCQVQGATDEELNWFEDFSYWTEGVVQLALGSVGFVANSMVIPILCTKKMNSIFNHNLIYLAIFDNIYVLCAILECIRKYFLATQIQTKLFVYGLYQLQHIAFTCSVYQTIVLAFQRYLAISRPIEYYVDNSVVSMGNGPNGRSILRYMAPVMLFSILFNLPKFFEIDLEEYEFFDTYDNVTKMDLRLKPSKLRLDDNYCFYYVNLARFVVSGLFPFVTLTYLHVAIYRAIQARRETIQTTLGLQQSEHQSLDTCSTVEELVLFVIVWIFFLCTIPRIVMNIYEMVSLERIRNNINNDCLRFPLWVLMTTTATYILTSFNCCINFVVYFVMYQAFRKELKATAQLLQKRISSRLSSIKETYSSRKTMHHRCSKDKETSGQKGIELREINP